MRLIGSGVLVETRCRDGVMDCNGLFQRAPVLESTADR